MQRGSNPSSGAVDLANSRELVKILLLVLAKIFLFLRNRTNLTAKFCVLPENQGISKILMPH
ncbi:MAG: hypothetical protein RL117_1849 [Verrucomicrobiota bacterium]|jgi:hypothetical protein